MDQSNSRVNLQGSDLVDAWKILRTGWQVYGVEVARRSWSVCEIDDKLIFDEDARQIASANALTSVTWLVHATC